MKETIVDVEFEEIPEETNEENETFDDNEDNEEFEEDAEISEEEQSEEESQVNESINVNFDDIPLNTELNNLGIFGLSCIIILFLLGTIAVLRGD